MTAPAPVAAAEGTVATVKEPTRTAPLTCSRAVGAAPVPMDDLDLDVVLKTDPAQGLVLTSRLPMTAINELLRRSSIGIDAGPDAPATPKAVPKTTTTPKRR